MYIHQYINTIISFLPLSFFSSLPPLAVALHSLAPFPLLEIVPSVHQQITVSSKPFLPPSPLLPSRQALFPQHNPLLSQTPPSISFSPFDGYPTPLCRTHQRFSLPTRIRNKPRIYLSYSHRDERKGIVKLHTPRSPPHPGNGGDWEW